MLSNTILSAAASIIALPCLVMAAPQTIAPRASAELSLTAQLRLADTVIDRFKLLPDDKDFVYDFNSTDPAAAVASSKNFPALVGTGASLSVVKLDACSMSTVHLHPRAAELQAVVSGRILTEMVPESGVVDSEGKPRVIRTELGPGMMTVFYQGSFHTQINPDCEPAVLVAGFASEDIGASLIASQASLLSNDVISNTFGGSISGKDIDAVRDMLPQGVSVKIDECLKKCGIEKRKV
ncbi:hypothetical protein QQX98_007746 [Neonectria punicea]|uniref:Cupin type-1 domain-containing protein n=1 Tax=Neonectria punicea TaxID=979145 RepID=A0ABR1GX15_9HYPO